MDDECDEALIDGATLAMIDAAGPYEQDLTAFTKRMDAVRDHRWSDYWQAWADESRNRLARMQALQMPKPILQREQEMLNDRESGVIRTLAGLWPKYWSDLPDDYRMQRGCQCVVCRFVRRSE